VNIYNIRTSSAVRLGMQPMHLTIIFWKKLVRIEQIWLGIGKIKNKFEQM